MAHTTAIFLNKMKIDFRCTPEGWPSVAMEAHHQYYVKASQKAPAATHVINYSVDRDVHHIAVERYCWSWNALWKR